MHCSSSGEVLLIDRLPVSHRSNFKRLENLLKTHRKLGFLSVVLRMSLASAIESCQIPVIGDVFYLSWTIHPSFVIPI